MLLHLKLHGQVQGVFLRQNTQKKGQSLGLLGWVKNLEDGTVEVAAQGERGALLKLLEWIRNGPGSSQVKRVEKKWKQKKLQVSEFEIRY